MQRRTFVASALGLPLAGCLAMPYGIYFRPETDDAATPQRAWCGGQAGPTTGLQLELAPGTKLTASTAETAALAGGSKAWALRLLLSVAPGTRCAFAGPAWRLTELSGGRALDVPTRVRLRATLPLATGERVDARALHPGGGVLRAARPDTPFGVATMRLVGPVGVAPQAFTLSAPALQVGEALHRLPAIDLQRAAATSSARTLYRDPTLPGGPEALSFERRSGPVLWRGEWDHFDKRYDQRPVHGRIDVRVATAEPWRWLDTPFELQDAADGRRHALAFDGHAISFDDEVALDTPLQTMARRSGPGIAANAFQATTLVLEATLPADTASFQLQLPALLIDGQPRPIAPLRFVRRSFDGGIEPFNC